MYDCSNGLEALAAVGDDYMYKLSWLVCEVRRHGYELKQIDQKIKDAVKVELSDERVQSIVEDIISNLSGIINVKTPPDELKPAVGDGSENDGEALQDIIDYAGQHGAAVYFPSGDYLTDPLTVPHDVSLYGYDRYQTRLVLAGGAETPMLEINGMGHTIQGITLDGNAANQVNEVVTLKVSGADILLTQLVIDNSYVGLDFSGTNGHLQMTDIIFGSMTAMAALIVGDVKVQAQQLIFNSLSAIKGEYVIEIGANRGSYQFASVATCETCLNLTGNDNHIEMDCINATNDYQDTGLRNTVYVYGKSEKVQLSGDKDVTVRGSQSVNVDGSSSTNVGLNESTVVQGNRNLGVIGTNTESYTGNSTEDYSGNRVSNVKGKDTLNARDLFLNPVNPLTYRQPTFPSKFYGVVPFKDPFNNEFNFMVESPNTLIGYRPINVVAAGIANDGVTDVTSSLKQLFYDNHDNPTMYFFPRGTYRLTNNVPIPPNTYILGEGYGTYIYMDNAVTYFGTTMSAFGSNITIDNVRVGYKGDDGLPKAGSMAGAIGFSCMDYLAAYDGSRNKWSDTTNVRAYRIYSDSYYVLQAEPTSTTTMSYITYDKIYAPRGVVSVQGNAPETARHINVSDVVCDHMRIGVGGGIYANIDNIRCHSYRFAGKWYNISNIMCINSSTSPWFQAKLNLESASHGGEKHNITNVLIDSGDTNIEYGLIINRVPNSSLTNVKSLNALENAYIVNCTPMMTNCIFEGSTPKTLNVNGVGYNLQLTSTSIVSDTHSKQAGRSINTPYSAASAAFPCKTQVSATIAISHYMLAVSQTIAVNDNPVTLNEYRPNTTVAFLGTAANTTTGEYKQVAMACGTDGRVTVVNRLGADLTGCNILLFTFQHIHKNSYT